MKKLLIAALLAAAALYWESGLKTKTDLAMAATGLAGAAVIGRKDGKPGTAPTEPATPPQDPPTGKKPGEGDSTAMTPDEVKAMFGELIKEQLTESLAEHRKGLVTDELLKQAIGDAIKSLKADSTTIQKDDLKAIAEQSVKNAMEGLRKDKRFTRDPGDGKQEQHDIEVPTSWRKGNLPLHGKQLLNRLMGRPMNEGVDESTLSKGTAHGDRIIDSYRAMAKQAHKFGSKAMTSTGSTTGDELVPSDLSAELQRRLYLESALAQLMMLRELDMPTEDWRLPVSLTRPSFYLASTENTASDASDPTFGQPTMSSKRLIGKVEYSYELDEDSIIPILPILQQLLAEGAADAWEHALINGDDTATHQDTDEEALTNSPAFAFKGFRKLSLAISGLKSDLSTGGLTKANLDALRKLLKKYGTNPRNLIWLCSPTSALALQAIAEVSTLEKFGARATILTGELAALSGIPIITSERVREDVDATGVNGASGNTKATVQVINLTRFLTGRRREFMIETDRNIESQKNVIVASFRKAFLPIETPSASVTSCAIGYNFTP